MYCPKCGRKALGEERFCARCGTRLTRPGIGEKKAARASEEEKKPVKGSPPAARKPKPAAPPEKARPTATEKRPVKTGGAKKPTPVAADKRKPAAKKTSKLRKWLRRRLRGVRRTYRRLKRRIDFRDVMISRRFRLAWQRFKLKLRDARAIASQEWQYLIRRFERWKSAVFGGKAPVKKKTAAKRKPRPTTAAQSSKPKARPVPAAGFADEPKIDIFELKPSARTAQSSPAGKTKEKPPEKLHTRAKPARRENAEKPRRVTADIPQEAAAPRPKTEKTSPDRLVFPWEIHVTADSLKEAPRPQPKKAASPVSKAPRRPAPASKAKGPSGKKAAQNRRAPNAPRGNRKPSPSRPNRAGNHPPARRRPAVRESFLEKHLRSLIAMLLLGITVIMMLVWSVSTATGQRLFAQLGLGGAPGYIILGDECMESGNYGRAVEHYYKALTKNTEYESAIKLARAYRQTGDAEREVSALLLCIDQFEEHREPYERLKQIYPFPSTRPAMVKEALLKGVSIFSDITLAY